jgi:hypothetical protein
MGGKEEDYARRKHVHSFAPLSTPLLLGSGEVVRGDVQYGEVRRVSRGSRYFRQLPKK